MLNNDSFRRFTGCPSCGRDSAAADVMFSCRLLGTFDCPVVSCSCGLIFKLYAPSESALREVYGDGYVHFSDSTDLPKSAVTSFRTKLRTCQALLGNAPVQSIRLLDVGCASGSFVELAARDGFAAEGIDPYLPDAMQSTRLRKGSPEDVREDTFDVVSMLNVLEHVSDPMALLGSARRILTSRGLALFTCPYGDSLARRAYRDQWNHLALDEHLLFWTPKSLEFALRRAGFRGVIKFRVAGSPFPLGRVRPTAAPKQTPPETASDVSAVPPPAPRQPSVLARAVGTLQRGGWEVGRRIQAFDRPANAVRWIVDRTRTGDYLECFAKAT